MQRGTLVLSSLSQETRDNNFQTAPHFGVGEIQGTHWSLLQLLLHCNKQLYLLWFKLLHLSIQIWKGLSRAGLSLFHLTGNGMCVLPVWYHASSLCVCMHMYLCMFMCLYARVSAHVHVCVYACVSVNVHVCVCTLILH